MSLPRRRNVDNIHWLAIVAGLASFVPVLGIPFTVLAVAWGIYKWRAGRVKLVVALGVGGLLLTVGVYWFGFRTKQAVVDSCVLQGYQSNIASQILAQHVRSIEYYRLVHGTYPDALDQLKQPQGTVSEMLGLHDLTAPTPSPGAGTDRLPYYYYQLHPSGESYYLLGVGADGLPFTEDDVLPAIPVEDLEQIGLKMQSEGR